MQDFRINSGQSRTIDSSETVQLPRISERESAAAPCETPNPGAQEEHGREVSAKTSISFTIKDREGEIPDIDSEEVTEWILQYRETTGGECSPLTRSKILERAAKLRRVLTAGGGLD